MPIVMTKAEWDRIHKWTNYDAEDPEVVRRREYVKLLDENSRAMTKSWPNSLENVNKRSQELRLARKLQAEQTNSRFYARYLRKKKEEQERLMYSARDMVFKNKDAPKLLLSAVIETAVQKEREEQVKFLNELRREEAERKRQDDDDIIRRAKEWNELIALRKTRKWDVNKQHQKDILDQAHEVAERNRMEYETELNLQKIDNIKANEQREALKEFDAQFKAEGRARIFRDIDNSRKMTNEKRREQDAREKMDDKLMELLQKSRCKIEQRRKQTEADLKNEKLRVLEKISQRLESGDAARVAKEQAILDKAVKEKNEINEARLQEQLRKAEQFKQDRKASREKFLRDEQQRLHEFNTTRQWDIMNRFKNVEMNKDFQEHLRKEKERKIAEYRAEILRLWKERDDREAKERADSRYFYGELAEQKLRDADNKLLTHAASLLQEAKEHGRPDYALHRAIDAYCKLYRLYPMPDLPKSVKEHFRSYAPWDGSRPDADYRASPAPAPRRAPAAQPGPLAPPAELPGPLAPPAELPGPLAPPAELPGPLAPPAELPGPLAPPAELPGPLAPPATLPGPLAPPAALPGPLAPPTALPGRLAPLAAQGKADGLQAVGKPGPSKPPVVKKGDADYKRAAPANGLQRRNLQQTYKLPPISVVQYNRNKVASGKIGTKNLRTQSLQMVT